MNTLDPLCGDFTVITPTLLSSTITTVSFPASDVLKFTSTNTGEDETFNMLVNTNDSQHIGIFQYPLKFALLKFPDQTIQYSIEIEILHCYSYKMTFDKFDSF